jgi:hypothetical protein
LAAVDVLDGDGSVEGHHVLATPRADGDLEGGARAARCGPDVVVRPSAQRRARRRRPLRTGVDGCAGTDPSGPGAYLPACGIAACRCP